MASATCHPSSQSALIGPAEDPGSPRAAGRYRQMIPGMGMGGGGGMGTLQALLTELSGLKKPRGFFSRIVRRTLGMRPKPPPKYRNLVIMATNMPSALDQALLRPGRLDRVYRVYRVGDRVYRVGYPRYPPPSRRLHAAAQQVSFARDVTA